VPHEFSSFCPVAIAAIGRLPRSIADRAIHVRMRKAMRGEIKREFRPDKAMKAFEPLRRRAMRFAVDNMERLAEHEPEMPAGAFNRFADNWRPLATIADVAGGPWPERARAAIVADLGKAEDDELGLMLLEDLRLIFDEHADEDGKPPARQLSSAVMVIALKDLSDRPWNELGRQRAPITQNKLARMLEAFEIHPHGTIKLMDGKTAKGYRRRDFEETWARYLSPPVISADSTVTPSPLRETAAHEASKTQKQEKTQPSPRHLPSSKGDGVTVAKKAVEQAKTTKNPRKPANGDGVTVADAENTEGHIFAAPMSTAELRRVRGVEVVTPVNAPAPGGLTPAQAAQLSKLGVHHEVLRELTPRDAESLLGDPPIIPRNACKAPKDDLRELAKVLGMVSTPSADLADMAVQYGGGVAITADMVDAIRQGGWAPYAVRDALWTALS
jgi:uncharacterized protein DUF3631